MFIDKVISLFGAFECSLIGIAPNASYQIHGNVPSRNYKTFKLGY
jgi:hypothetical protein